MSKKDMQFFVVKDKELVEKFKVQGFKVIKVEEHGTTFVNNKKWDKSKIEYENTGKVFFTNRLNF